jgi:Mg-chelatase subunit ChlD
MGARKAVYNTVSVLILLLLLWDSAFVSHAGAQSDTAPETLDLVFVIDNSNSMSGAAGYPPTDEYNLRIATARVLIDVASTDFEASRVRVGVITFGDQAVHQTEGLVYANAIARARDIVQPARQGNTVIEQAFRAAYQMLAEGGTYTGTHTAAVVFMTDGRPYDGYAHTPEDFGRLFDNAQPWIDRLAQAETPVYIAAFNPLEEIPVLDQERWQAFANTTGGEYYAVRNVEEASALFEDIIVKTIYGRKPDVILEGQFIEPGEVVSAEFEVDAFLDRLTIAAVHTHLQANRYIEAGLFGPDGDGGEVEIRCGQQNQAAENLLCRGLEQDDTETVWTLVRPQPGTWRVELTGGEGYIKVWKAQRAFGLAFIRPRQDVLLSPGSPLEVEVGLCETDREAQKSCQHDPGTAVVGKLNYREEFLTRLQMTVAVQDPGGTQTQPATMTYDTIQTRFTHLVTQQAEHGIYRVDVVLYYGEAIKPLGANSTTVYVGYLPAIGPLAIAEKDDDRREGISALEPLELRVLLQNPELAVPGSLAMTGSTLTYPDGNQVSIAPTAASGVNNLFTATLGPFDAAGTYLVEARLSGQVQADEETLFDFGRVNQPQVVQTATFEVQPLAQPRLESVTVLSRTTTGQAIPVQASVPLSRRASQTPVVEAELFSPNGQVVSSIVLITRDNPFPSGQLTYAGELRAPGTPGRYTVRVSLADRGSQESAVVVQYPLWVRIGMWTAGLLALAGIGYGVYWYVAVRDLVQRVVIGTLIIEKKVAEGIYEQQGDPVALSSEPRREIWLLPYAPDPEVAAVRARLVGRVKNRRDLVEPLLKMDRETADVTVDGVRMSEQPLRNGVQILTPSYRITYRSGGESGSAVNVDITLPPSGPQSGGINV